MGSKTSHRVVRAPGEGRRRERLGASERRGRRSRQLIEERALVEHARVAFGLRLASTSRVVGGVADLLADGGIRGVPPPLRPASGQPWSTLGNLRVSLTPWIQGPRGVDAPMTHDQRRSFGALLAGVHAVDLPPSVQAALPREDHATATAAAATVRALAAQVRGPRDPGGRSGRRPVGARPDPGLVVRVALHRGDPRGRRAARRPAPCEAAA